MMTGPIITQNTCQLTSIAHISVSLTICRPPTDLPTWLLSLGNRSMGRRCFHCLNSCQQTFVLFFHFSHCLLPYRFSLFHFSHCLLPCHFSQISLLVLLFYFSHCLLHCRFLQLSLLVFFFHFWFQLANSFFLSHWFCLVLHIHDRISVFCIIV